MALGDYSVGSSGSGVSDLQSYLNDVGFSISVDGQYGGETRAAVLAFQSAQGISVDGIAGPETLVALAMARATGWTMPAGAAPVPVTAGASHVIGGTLPGLFPTAPAAPGTKPAMKLNPIIILVGVAVVLWFMNQKKSAGGGTRAPMLDEMETDPEPDEEPEEEPEEPEEEEDDETEDDDG